MCVQCHWFLTSVSRDRAIRTLSLSRWFPSNRIQPSSNLEQSEQLQPRSPRGEAKLPTTTKSNFDFSCSQISSVQIRNNISSDRTLATEIQRMEWMEWVMKILGLRTAVLKKLINSLAHGWGMLRSHGTHKVRLSLYSARKNLYGATWHKPPSHISHVRKSEAHFREQKSGSPYCT